MKFTSSKGIRKRKVAYKRKPKTTKSVSLAVKKYVKRTIHSNIENKCVQINSGGSFGTINQDATLHAYPMLPLTGYWGINTGVGQGNRVGNIITVRKVRLNYIIRPNPFEATINVVPKPCDVQLFLGYVRNTPSFNPINLDIAQLFQSGSTSSAPVGTTRDVISVINKDYWIIKKRWTHKIGYASNTGSNPQAAPQFYANNDYKFNAINTIDITKMCPTKCIFNDAASTTNTRNLFFFYQSVYADGSTGNASQLPVNIDYWIDFHYEDA